MIGSLMFSSSSFVGLATVAGTIEENFSTKFVGKLHKTYHAEMVHVMICSEGDRLGGMMAVINSVRVLIHGGS